MLGITLGIDSYPFAQYAIRDLVNSIKQGEPIKEKQPCAGRILLEINCIMKPTCNGVTTPADVSAWLLGRTC